MRVPVLRQLLSLIIVCIAVTSVCSQEQEVESATMTIFGDLIELGRQLRIETAGDEQPLDFYSTPVLNWDNPTRGTGQKGCVFIWHRNQRPQVIGSIFTYGNDKQNSMRHELHSLSERGLIARYGEQLVWRPTQPGIQWQSVENVPKPRLDARLRLTQMRGIARRYSATLEDPRGDQIELELKPTPLHRYASKEQGVLDGAIFSLANGTDPEALLLVEATSGDGSAWRIGFARFHYWKVFAQDSSGKKVWQAEPVMELLSSSIGDARAISPAYTSYLVERRLIEPK